MKFIVNPRLLSLGYKISEVDFYFYYCSLKCILNAPINVKPRGGLPWEFNLPAILKGQQNLKMSYPPSWYREEFGYHPYMPTLPSNPGVSRIQNLSVSRTGNHISRIKANWGLCTTISKCTLFKTISVLLNSPCQFLKHVFRLLF